ncbi:unnamed protein product [Owenia fusiformis]|uniref:Uncharacterized protein n=1 Tax=Owenia fusiformis TaxID=6347 RepID=A0A8J1U102_OWEFU|nr:unnamed protein product [Owenia fusiformis]
MAQKTDKLYLVENKNTIRKLASLRNCGQLTDLQFVFPDGSQIDAHKAIVAQYSSVIAAKCVDIDQHKLQILSTDIDNEEMIEPNVMNIMLDYIYGQQVTILRDNIQQVMRLAIKLNVPEFLADCDNILFQNKPPVDKITGTHIKQEVTELGYDSQPARPSGRGRSGNSVSASKNLNEESPALKRTGTKRTIKKTLPEYVEPELDDIDDGMDDTMDNDDEEDTDEYEPDVEFKDENDDANYIDGTSATPRKRQKSSSKKEKKEEEANVNPLVCELCDKTFETHKESAEHQRDVHNTIACDICAKVFNNEPDLRRHGVLHTEEMLVVDTYSEMCIYQCSRCHSPFPSARELIAHAKTIHEANLLQCRVCNKITKCVKEYCQHYLTHQQNQGYDWRQVRRDAKLLGKHKCPYESCEYVSSRSGTLNRHIKQTHLKLPYFKCETCAQEFVYKFKLRKHMKDNPECAKNCTVSFKKHVCEIPSCGKVFETAGNLAKHKTEFHLKIKAYKCETCKEEFVYYLTFKSHFLHSRTCEENCPSNLTFVVCDVCGKKFNSASKMKRHKLDVHERGAFNCQSCDAIFSTESNLMMHKRRKHDAKEHICSYCGRAFGLPFDLRNHERIHTGEKPFHCDICDVSFIQQSILIKHRRSDIHVHRVNEWNKQLGTPENEPQPYTNKDDEQLRYPEMRQKESLENEQVPYGEVWRKDALNNEQLAYSEYMQNKTLKSEPLPYTEYHE